MEGTFLLENCIIVSQHKNYTLEIHSKRVALLKTISYFVFRRQVYILHLPFADRQVLQLKNNYVR